MAAGYMFFSRPLLRAQLPPAAFLVCSAVYSHAWPHGCTYGAAELAAELGTVTEAEVESALAYLISRQILREVEVNCTPAYAPEPPSKWVNSGAHHKRSREREERKDLPRARAMPPTTDHTNGVGVGSRDSEREGERERERETETAASEPVEPDNLTVLRCRQQMRALAEKFAVPTRLATPAGLPDFDAPPAHVKAHS